MVKLLLDAFPDDDLNKQCRSLGASAPSSPQELAERICPGLLSALLASADERLPTQARVEYERHSPAFERMTVLVAANDMCSLLTPQFRRDQLSVLTSVLNDAPAEKKATMVDDLLCADDYYVDAIELESAALPPLFQALLMPAFPNQVCAPVS